MGGVPSLVIDAPIMDFHWAERMSVFTKRVSKSFERLDVSTERVIKPFERMQTFFERVTQVVRTDANFLRTTSKWLVNGIPFENGKSLVYVFP